MVMNNKGEVELSPVGILLGLIGAGFGYYISNSMNPGFFWVIISTLACGAVGVIMASIASNN